MSEVNPHYKALQHARIYTYDITYTYLSYR